MRVIHNNPYDISESASEYEEKTKLRCGMSSRLKICIQVFYHVVILGLVITVSLVANANFDQIGNSDKVVFLFIYWN